MMLRDGVIGNTVGFGPASCGFESRSLIHTCKECDEVALSTINVVPVCSDHCFLCEQCVHETGGVVTLCIYHKELRNDKTRTA